MQPHSEQTDASLVFLQFNLWSIIVGGSRVAFSRLLELLLAFFLHDEVSLGKLLRPSDKTYPFW